MKNRVGKRLRVKVLMYLQCFVTSKSKLQY